MRSSASGVFADMTNSWNARDGPDEGRAGASSSTTWAFVPPTPSELTPARRGASPGHGNDFATIAGATVGAAVGYNNASRKYGPQGHEETVERCDVRYEHTTEERIDGYHVTYEYNGREYTTRLPYDPGERIKVRVAVAPAE